MRAAAVLVVVAAACVLHAAYAQPRVSVLDAPSRVARAAYESAAVSFADTAAPSSVSVSEGASGVVSYAQDERTGLALNDNGDLEWVMRETRSTPASTTSLAFAPDTAPRPDYDDESDDIVSSSSRSSSSSAHSRLSHAVHDYEASTIAYSARLNSAWARARTQQQSAASQALAGEAAAKTARGAAPSKRASVAAAPPPSPTDGGGLTASTFAAYNAGAFVNPYNREEPFFEFPGASPNCSYVGIASNGTLTTISCNGTEVVEVTVNSTTITVFGVNVTFPGGKVNVTQPRCNVTQSNTTACICPFDRMGLYCQDYRPYECNVTFLNGSRCSLTEDKTMHMCHFDDLGVSLPLSPSSLLDLTFELQCKFTNLSRMLQGYPANISLPDPSYRADNISFPYFALRLGSNETDSWWFALTRNVSAVASSLPVNMYQLSNTTFRRTHRLTARNWLALDPFSMNWTVGQMDKTFFAGGQLFIEVHPPVSLSGLSKARSTYVMADTRGTIVPFPYTAPPDPFPWWIFVIVGVVALLAVAIGVRVRRSVREKQKAKAHTEMLYAELVARMKKHD